MSFEHVGGHRLSSVCLKGEEYIFDDSYHEPFGAGLPSGRLCVVFASGR